MKNKDAATAAGVGCAGCSLVLLLMGCGTLVIGPAIAWLVWNVLVVQVLSPAFQWNLPLLTYWQLVAVGFIISLLSGGIKIKINSD